VWIFPQLLFAGNAKFSAPNTSGGKNASQVVNPYDVTKPGFASEPTVTNAAKMAYQVKAAVLAACFNWQQDGQQKDYFAPLVPVNSASKGSLLS
jgi:hypothetical protein